MLHRVLASGRGSHHRDFILRPVDYTKQKIDKDRSIKRYDVESAESKKALSNAGKVINRVGFIVDGTAHAIQAGDNEGDHTTLDKQFRILPEEQEELPLPLKITSGPLDAPVKKTLQVAQQDPSIGERPIGLGGQVEIGYSGKGKGRASSAAPPRVTILPRTEEEDGGGITDQIDFIDEQAAGQAAYDTTWASIAVPSRKLTRRRQSARKSH
jgi:hypothetical protein